MSNNTSSDWICDNCLESVPARFNVCWSCGTSVDGRENPKFQHVDDYVADLPDNEGFNAPPTSLLVFVSTCLIFFVLLGSRMTGLVKLTFMTVTVFGAIWILLICLAAIASRVISRMRQNHLRNMSSYEDPERGEGITWESPKRD